MNKYILKIEGMKCSMCESHINDSIRRRLPVKKVKSSHKNNETIDIMDGEISNELFHDIIDPTGYKLDDIKKEEAKRIGLFWK